MRVEPAVDEDLLTGARHVIGSDIGPLRQARLLVLG
jgi:hypothetical protein